MKSIIFLFVTIFVTANAMAQNLKGTVTDKAGAPIYGTTIFIKEANHGFVCNEDGFYQTTLPAGNYTAWYRCLGYGEEERKITITDKTVSTVDVVLHERPFILKEVVATNMEDPAYAIMRKAIEKATHYTQIVKKYDAEAYIKGNMELLKVPKFFDKMMQKSEGVKASELKDQTFVQESFNEINFTAPNKYIQTVKAFSSSIPDNLDSKEAFGIMKGSIYTPILNGRVSPLNENAFSYYRFRYEGFNEENGMVINKIKIIPKLKDPILFSGYIYVADDTWHVTSANITGEGMGLKQNYVIAYQQVVKDAYLPISYLISSEINILGLNATISHYASLKYSNIEINYALASDFVKRKKKKKRELEIKKDSLYTTIADTLATDRDSTYWAAIRTTPLELKELKSFERKDSVQQRIDSIRKKNKSNRFEPIDLFFGGRIGSDSALVKVKYGGLLTAVAEYNYVDGFWLGEKVNIEVKLDRRKLTISPYAYYASARNRAVGGLDFTLNYAPLKLGEFRISLGSTSSDFNYKGTVRIDNAFASLVYGENESFYYQNDFVEIGNRIDLANGLRLETGFLIAKRSGLSNNTDYSLFGARRKIQPNIKNDEQFDKTSILIGLTYTPFAYYSISNKVKKYEDYRSPSLFVIYKQGIADIPWQTNNSVFKKISVGINQDIKLDYFKSFDYSFAAGTFVGSASKVDFTDFHHFDASNVFSNVKSPFDSYLLLNSYSQSTNRFWIDWRVNYMSNYILIKRLPFLQGKLFTESLHIKSLYTPDKELYSELGYAINLSRRINFGVFSSFDNLKYRRFAFRLSVNLGLF